MCKAPKVKQPEAKKPVYLSNPYLDGLAIASEPGRNGLRVDLASPSAAPAVGVVRPTRSVSSSLAIPQMGAFGIPRQALLREHMY